jgi:hypothetical protein
MLLEYSVWPWNAGGELKKLCFVDCGDVTEQMNRGSCSDGIYAAV